MAPACAVRRCISGLTDLKIGIMTETKSTTILAEQQVLTTRDSDASNLG